MPLQVILIDKEKLIEHDNWSEPLGTLLLSLHKHKLAVADIGKISLHECGDGVFLPAQSRNIPFSDALVIADCEETLQKAKAVNAAVLGYEPPKADNGPGISSGSIFYTEPNPEWEGKIQSDRLIHSHLDYLVEGFEEVDFHFLERVYQRHHNLPWTVLETERCYLREVALDDLDALYRIYEAPEITRYMEGLCEEREKEEARTKAYIEHMYRFYGYGLWAVIEKETEALIGRAGLEHLNIDGETHLQLGYAIALSKQNKGYAFEVCRAVLKYAKEELNAPKIYCLIHPENKISIRLACKLGFRYEKNEIYRGKDVQRYVKILQFP